MIGKKARLLCLSLALTAFLMTACGGEPKEPDENAPNETENAVQQQTGIPSVTAPEDEPYVEPPTAPPVQIVMPEYELIYSGEMADIISCQELTDTVGLQFFVMVGQGKWPLFTMELNKTEGDVVQVISNTAGEPVTVSFRMEEVPAELNGEDAKTFCLAQDKVNEIIASLKIK